MNVGQVSPAGIGRVTSILALNGGTFFRGLEGGRENQDSRISKVGKGRADRHGVSGIQ